MLISITIPVFNNSKGLIKSIQSLLDQTYANWEVVIVDDGSDISLEHLICQYNDDRIIFYRFEKNQGRPVARQKSFELISGEYVGFLDAGDYFSSDYLEIAVSLFCKNDLLGVSQSMIILFDGQIYKSSYRENVIDLYVDGIGNINFAATIFSAKVCKNYHFNKKLKFSQDKHFLKYIENSFEGRISLINSYNYFYDQGNIMKIKTTINKYYFDLKRIGDEKNIFGFFIGLLKLVAFPIIHYIFGYQFLLKMRYEKQIQ